MPSAPPSGYLHAWYDRWAYFRRSRKGLVESGMADRFRFPIGKDAPVFLPAGTFPSTIAQTEPARAVERKYGSSGNDDKPSIVAGDFLQLNSPHRGLSS